jgi:hypothetical protein
MKRQHAPGAGHPQKYVISEDDARLIVALKDERDRLKGLIARYRNDKARRGDVEQWRRESQQITDARIGEKFELPMHVVRKKF